MTYGNVTQARAAIAKSATAQTVATARALLARKPSLFARILSALGF